jgi:hypothetical protein
MTKIRQLVRRAKPLLTLGVIMLMPLALAACPTHTHIHG